MLGMYVHTHWGYHHPYAARTWTLRDWEGYLSGLSALGFDFVMIWPLLDSMPPEPNASDRAFLQTLAGAIDLAHARFGMRVAVVVAPNTIGSAEAARHAFTHRPYFACEVRIDPKDAEAKRAFLAGRRNQLAFLRGADALAIIDSDPGGFPGSTCEELVELMDAQLRAFRTLNPAAELIYWMWLGWEHINRFHAATAAGDEASMLAEDNAEEFTRTLALLRDRVAEPWWLYHCRTLHDGPIDALGLRDRALWFPYGLLEGEPTFPLINCDVPALAAGLAPERLARCGRGVMGNLQNHALQLPHTLALAHLAHGGTPASLDLTAAAEDLLPGLGETLARGWRAIASRDPDRMRAAMPALRAAVGRPHRPGRLAGLLFGDPDRFLTDLAMNLAVRAALETLPAAPDRLPALRRTLAVLRPYQQRLGFADAFYGPLADALFPALTPLKDPAIADALRVITTWHAPELRNGSLVRLLDAVEEYCQRETR